MNNSGLVQRGDITARLVANFKDLIKEGTLKLGCKLPPERELARTFGVSRSSLRQALKVLEVIGIVTQRVGDGTYLSNRASGILTAPFDFLISLEAIGRNELVEARLIIEPEMAARAAERATAADIQLIRKELDNMKSHRSEPLKIVEHDLAFHEAIQRAGRNRICASMFDAVHRAIFANMSVTTRLVDLKHTLKFHKAIYEAIQGRNPEAAKRAMTQHILDFRDLLEKADIAPKAVSARFRPLPRAPRKARAAKTL